MCFRDSFFLLVSFFANPTETTKNIFLENRLPFRIHIGMKLIILNGLALLFAAVFSHAQLLRVDNDTTSYLTNGFVKTEVLFELKTMSPNVSIISSQVHPSQTHFVLGYNVSYDIQSPGVIRFQVSIVFLVPGRSEFKLTVELSNWDFLGYRITYSQSVKQNVFGIGLLSESHVPVLSNGGKAFQLFYDKFVGSDEKPKRISTIVYPPIFSQILSLANISAVSGTGILSKTDVNFQKNGLLVVQVKKYVTGSALIEIQFPHVFLKKASNNITVAVSVSNRIPPPPVVIGGNDLIGTLTSDGQRLQVCMGMLNVPNNILDVMVFSRNVSFSLNKAMSKFNSSFQKIIVETKVANFGDSSASSKRRVVNTVYVRMSHGLAVQAIISKKLSVTFATGEETENTNVTKVDDKCRVKSGQQCPLKENDVSESPSGLNDTYLNDSGLNETGINGTGENKSSNPNLETSNCSKISDNNCSFETELQDSDKLRENNVVAIVTVSILAFITAVIICVALVRWWRSRSVYYPWPGREGISGESPPFGSNSNRGRRAFNESP